ncbi:MAG: GAF domain-containing protein [Anaerolineae bacterium]|nr:GAF domain-containing protein [Anaerolineae bacterium]
MTEFGRLHLESWFRTRAVLFAVGFLLTLAVTQMASIQLFVPLLVVFALDVVLSAFGIALAKRFTAPHVVRVLLLLDLLLTFLIVFYAGGLDGGFTAIYLIVVLGALLMLGQRAAFHFAVLASLCFATQLLLEVAGIHSFQGPSSTLIEIIGQGVVLAVLITLALFLANASANLNLKLAVDKDAAQAERARAERLQRQWALIHNVALRVQESTSPSQVYVSIGDELERIGLHCAILEWAQPNVSFRISHISSDKQVLESAQGMGIDPYSLRLELKNAPQLARAVETRMPELVVNVEKEAASLLPHTGSDGVMQMLALFEADTLINAPLVTQDSVRAILIVWGKDLGEHDKAPLAALAQQAASALEKAELLTEQQKRAAQLELVSNIAARVSAAENAEQIIQPLVQQIGNRFHYQAVSVLLMNDAGDQLAVAASYSVLSATQLTDPHYPLERGILGWVARHGETYLARDTRTDPIYHSPHPDNDPIHSELVIPLRAQNKLLGVLDLESTEPDAFDVSDVNALTLLADQVSAALTKTRALELESKRAAQLALVSEIAARAGAFSDPDAIISAMVQLVQERFGYHHVCLSLYDAARDELEQSFAAGANAAQCSPGVRWNTGETLIGLAARTRQTTYSGDLKNDARNGPADGAGNSALCVPLVSDRTVLGVLKVESDRLYAFDSNDIGAMETLANQMAAALEKARLLQAERRRTAQLGLVNRIASRTARLIPATQLMRDAVALIRTQFGYYNVAVFVTMEDQPGARLAANAGPLSMFLQEPFVMTAGIIAYVCATGNTYLCSNPHHDPHYVSPFARRADDPVRSELAIPLRRGESIIGVLDIQSEQAKVFSAGDISALEALADQLAAALENARLYESGAQHVAQLEAVRVLSLELTAERDVDVLLASIVTSAEQLVQAEGALLEIVDETRGDLVVRISHNLQHNYVGYRLKMGEDVSGRVVATGEPVLIADYANWEGRSSKFEREHFVRLMGVPLKWQNRVLGVINLHRGADKPLFNTDELRFANLFAAQAAIAMENARLLDALQTQLDAQQVLSESSATLLGTAEPQAILEQAAATTLRALHCDRAGVLLPDAGGKLIEHAHAGSLCEPSDDSSSPAATVLERAYSTKQPVTWNDSTTNESPPGPSVIKRPGFRAALAAPMLSADGVVGVIAIHSQRERHFDAADVQTLSLVANQTASALERARYFLQVQGQVRELNLLFEGSRAASSTLDPAQVVAHMLEQLVRAFDLTSAYFVRVDHPHHQLTQTHAYYSDQANARERDSSVRVWSMEATPEIKQVLGHRVRISNAADAHLSAEMRAYMEQHAVHTILRVPLAAADEVLGYISLWDTRAPRTWGNEQIRFVQTLASQSAAALINAQVYQAAQARTRELQALHQASQLLNSTLDVRAICEYSMDSLRDSLGYHHVSLYFVENDRLRLQVQRGYSQPLDEIPLTRGVMARAANTRETVFLPDVSLEPEFLAALPAVQSEIAAPLLAGDRVLGVLNVETIRAKADAPGKELLTPADMQLLTTFANQLVVAIENARLFQETQQSLAQVRTLHIANQAVSANLELESVLERVAQQFVQALDVDFCTLLELDTEHRELVVLFDLDPDTRAQVKIGDRFALGDNQHFEWVLETTLPRVFHIDDPALDPNTRAELLQYLCRTELTLPLISKGRVIGLIELGDRKQVREFRPDEIQLATSLASQAAVALANARLYHAARQRLQETETLYRFARELGGVLEIEQLGKRALDAAARLTDFDVGEVSLVRESDGALVPLVMTGGPDLDPVEYVLPHGAGIIGWVVAHGRAVRVGDVTRDPRYRAASPHIMSEMCLPLRAGERVIGVLNLEAKAPNAFDAHAEELLVVFANQLAIAIENARLYEQTKRDAEVKAALLRELSHRVKNNLAAITSLLYLALDEPADTREKILGETLGRVQSMTLAHALLARSGEARVNVLDLGQQVLNDAARNLTLPGAPVRVQVAGDVVFIGARQTTTLALVLNELATNSLRHGFDKRAQHTAPTLEFSVSLQRDQVICAVSDNGNGLPNAFALDAASGLGLSLVRTLVEKDLHGHFTLQQMAQGTRAEIRFRPEETLPPGHDGAAVLPNLATSERPA